MVNDPPDARGESAEPDDRAYLALTPRERSVLDVVERLGAADAGQVTAALGGSATHEAVRAALRVLARKQVLAHRAEGRRFVYRLAPAPAAVQTSALQRVVRRFFDGSPTRLIAALLDRSAPDLSQAELDEIAALIERARSAGR